MDIKKIEKIYSTYGFETKKDHDDLAVFFIQKRQVFWCRYNSFI